MPRMPMNAVAAKPLLSLVLLLLLTPQILARATQTLSVTEDVPLNDVSSFSGNQEFYTLTLPVNSDIILTTENAVEMFTHMLDDGYFTTGKPLSESVEQQTNPATEESKLVENLTTTTTPTPTTQQTTEATAEKLAELTTIINDSPEDSTIKMEQLDVFTEATTILPINKDVTHLSTENRAEVKSLESDKTNNLPPFESSSLGTHSDNWASTTSQPYKGGSVESTTEIDLKNFMTTFMSEPEFEFVTSRTTENNNSRIEDPLMHLLSLMSLNAFSEMAKLESEAESYLSEERKLVLTTNSAPTESSSGAAVPETTLATPREEPNLELTTADAPWESSTTYTSTEAVPDTTLATPGQQSILTAILMTTGAPETTNTPSATTSTNTESIPTPATSSTTTEELLMTTISSTTTEEIPIPTASSTTSEEIPITTTSSTTTEGLPTPTISSTTTEEIPMPTSSTTTESISIPTTAKVSISTTTSTTTESITIPTTSTSTTTESAPISTTSEVRQLQATRATRAPRIERIFNSDGVEVLYGYSSVVRTNRL